LISAVIAFLIASAVSAQEAKSRFQGVELFRDTLWLGNSDSDSAPSPVLGVWGAAAGFRMSDNLFFLPEIGFYGLDYFYRDGKALPAEIEYADAVGTLVVLLDAVLAWNFPLRDERLAVKAGTGPALSFKIPVVPHGDAPTGEVVSYFLQNLRFLHWEIKGVFEWDISKSLGLSVRLRTLLPVYRLWDGEGAPFYDGLLAGAGIGLRIRA
jgi:hypothetical protein